MVLLLLTGVRCGVPVPSTFTCVPFLGGSGGAMSPLSECSMSMDWDTGEAILSKDVLPLSVEGIRLSALATAAEDTGALMRCAEEEEECTGRGGGEETVTERVLGLWLAAVVVAAE